MGNSKAKRLASITRGEKVGAMVTVSLPGHMANYDATNRHRPTAACRHVSHMLSQFITIIYYPSESLSLCTGPYSPLGGVGVFFSPQYSILHCCWTNFQNLPFGSLRVHVTLPLIFHLCLQLVWLKNNVVMLVHSELAFEVYTCLDLCLSLLVLTFGHAEVCPPQALSVPTAVAPAPISSILILGYGLGQFLVGYL